MKKIVTVVLVTLFNINICFAQINFPIERPILKQGERWKTATVDALTKIATGWQEEIMIGVGADMLLTSVKTDGGAQSNHEQSQERARDVPRTTRHVGAPGWSPVSTGKAAAFHSGNP